MKLSRKVGTSIVTYASMLARISLTLNLRGLRAKDQDPVNRRLHHPSHLLVSVVTRLERRIPGKFPSTFQACVACAVDAAEVCQHVPRSPAHG